jgi:hypothetical protein
MPGAQPMTTETLIARLAALEERVLTLEVQERKKSARANAVNTLVNAWPGPFTGRQIYAALCERWPDLAGSETQALQRLTRMERQGLIIRTFQGRGPHPNIYVRSESPPDQAGRPGSRRGRKDAYESGLRAVIREALDTLPAEFTLPDVRAWVATHRPLLDPPQSSFSSTLYRLTGLGELRVVRGGRKSKSLKFYARGAKRVAPNGDEIRELEASWREFRATVATHVPEILPHTERHPERRKFHAVNPTNEA